MKPEKIVEEQIIMALKTVYDPELPVNIYALNGNSDFFVNVEMTVTSPNCPAIESLPMDIREAVEKLSSVVKCDVEVTFDPPWDKSFMSEEAKLELGML